MSSVYWDSMDFDSEGTLSTKNSSNPRNYVDPWDLENYAYIRKRLDPQQVISSSPSPAGEPLDSSFYYTPFEREQMYSEKGTTKYAGRSELEFKNDRFESESPIYYHQPYCDEELYGMAPDYSDMEEPSERYSPLVTDGSLLYMYETANRYRKVAMPRTPPQNIYSEKIYGGHYDDFYPPKYPNYAPLEEVYYGTRNSTIPIYDDLKTHRSKPNNFGLSNYGHLKIDYSCSWTNLDRFIGK